MPYFTISHSPGYVDASYATRELAEQHVARTREANADNPTYTEPTIAEVAGELPPCSYCDALVTTPKAAAAGADFCRNCFYIGNPSTARLAPVIEKLTALDVVSDASVWHTGGGCFVLYIGLKGSDGFVTAVEAYEVEGKWTGGDPVLPDTPEGPWFASVWPSEEAWSGEDENFDWDAAPSVCPADSDGLVEFVRTVSEED